MRLHGYNGTEAEHSDLDHDLTYSPYVQLDSKVRGVYDGPPPIYGSAPAGFEPHHRTISAAQH